MKFNHIGIACYDIEETSKFYLTQGYNRTSVVYDPLQNVNVCFLTKKSEDNMCIELVSPNNEKSPINEILKKNGVSPYHICYETENLEEDIVCLKEQKFLLVIKPIEAVAFNGRRVCFLFNKNVGLIELVEK